MLKSMSLLQHQERKRYAVIMAGGSGTRLWPLSRKERPKQFQSFLSSKTMLEETFDRVMKVVPADCIYISTTEQYRDLVTEHLPQMDAERIICEPSARGTAAAIALVAWEIAKKDPEALVATIASDHAIKNTGEFMEALLAAFSSASKYPDKLVTIGINPTWPDTGLGYIQMGEEMDKLGEDGKKRVFFIGSFQEKPDRKTAEKYLANWEYLWNAGYFIFSARDLLEHIQKLAPNIIDTFEKMDVLTESVEGQKQSADLYALLPSDPFDTLVVERLSKEYRLVIPSALEWSDVGNWSALFDFLKGQYESSFIAQGNHVDVGSEECFVHAGKKLVATLGLKNVVIVETEDVIFIADRKKSPEVKQLIEKLRNEGKHAYL